MIKRLLPQDTSIAELYSAIGLIFLALIVTAGAVNIVGLERVHPTEFWIVTLLSLGTLQLIAMVATTDLLILRCLISFVNGLIWLWISLTDDFIAILDPSDIAAWMLGTANLYAFVINSTLVKKLWS